MATPSDEVMTIPEVAKHLKLSPSKVYNMAKRGELPHFTAGKSVRVLRADLNQWVAERRAEANQP